MTFVCLGCRLKTFQGKRDPVTGELQCGGLVNHIKQKIDSNRQLACRDYYESLQSCLIVDIDLSTSLIGQKKKRKRNPLPADESSLPPDDPSIPHQDDFSSISSAESHHTNFSLKEDHPLATLFIPKSNSLSKNDHFLKFPPRPKPDPTPAFSHKDLNRKTLPSQKLTANISLNCIYKSAEELATMEANAREIMKQMEDRVNMEEQEDIGAEMILPDDYMFDVEYSATNNYNFDYIDDDISLQSESSTIGSDASAETIVHLVHPPINTNSYLKDRLDYEKSNSSDRSKLPPKVACHAELLRLQETHRFSMAAVTDILKWANLSVKLQPDIFQETMWTREHQVSEFRRYLGLQDTSFLFQETLVQWLPDNKPTVLWKRPFLDCVFELLTNDFLLGPNMDNLSLPHPSDPFKSGPDERSPSVSQLHHGTWWKDSFEDCCEENSIDILVPISFETDETFIDAHGKLSVTPFNIKLGIFNLDINAHEESSSTWFFLPNDTAEAANHEQTTHAVHKLQNLHSALKAAFQDLRDIMDNDTPVPWTIHYGGCDHKVNLKFAISYVVSDTAMHDKLCCHYGTRNAGVKCICRHCDCPTASLVDGDALFSCKNYKPKDLEPTAERTTDYWKNISHYPIANAFDDLYFGTNEEKIHMATPGEVLHMHQKGAMWRVVESLDFVWRGGKNIIMDNVSAASKQVNIKSSMENYDYLSHQMGRYLNRQSDRDKPRTKFSNSLFSKTKKNAHEQAGVILCLLLAMVSDRGRQIMLQERTMHEQFVANFVYVLELVLMFEVWIKKKKFKASQVLNGSRLSQGLGFYIKRISEIAVRGGMGALLIKNHLVLHIPDYIYRWGPPRGMDSANMERSHQTQAKRPAGLTQKRQDSFIYQTCCRYAESRIFKRIRRHFYLDQVLSNEIAGETKDPPKTCSGSHFELGVQQSTGEAAVKWIRNPGRLAHPQEVIDFAASCFLWNLNGNTHKVLPGFTEYRKVIDNVTQIFRAHPSFRSAGRQRRDVWYDWAVFDLSNHDGLGFRPAQILMFIDVPPLEEELDINGIAITGGKPYAVVRMFDDSPDSHFRDAYVGEDDSADGRFYSYLVKFGRLNDHFHILPCDLISDTAIVVPNIEARPYKDPPRNNRELNKRRKMDDMVGALGAGFFILEPRNLWGTFFGNLIDSFD